MDLNGPFSPDLIDVMDTKVAALDDWCKAVSDRPEGVPAGIVDLALGITEVVSSYNDARSTCIEDPRDILGRAGQFFVGTSLLFIADAVMALHKPTEGKP